MGMVAASFAAVSRQLKRKPAALFGRDRFPPQSSRRGTRLGRQRRPRRSRKECWSTTAVSFLPAASRFPSTVRGISGSLQATRGLARPGLWRQPLLVDMSTWRDDTGHVNYRPFTSLGETLRTRTW